MLQLFVLPPAFGLPSVDAECLAAITYMKHAVPFGEWELIADVHAIANGGTGDWTHLPVLWHDERQVHGYLRIVEYLKDISTGAWDLESRNRAPDGEAWILANHVQHRLSPLLSLLLYTTSDNYSSTVRPAFGKTLRFPSSWILPVNHQRQQEEKARAIYPEPTSGQLSALANSLADKSNTGGADSLSSRTDPLSDNDILHLSSTIKIPRENSTSAVIETYRHLQDLVKDAVSLHATAGEDLEEEDSGVHPDVYTCTLFAHIGLAVAAAKAGTPHPWFTDALQSQHSGLARATLRWLSQEWDWTPKTGGSLEHRESGRGVKPGLPWKTVEPNFQETARTLTSGIAQLSGVNHPFIPQAVYSRPVRSFSNGHARFSAREQPGKPLGHEVDSLWLGATGVTVAVLSYLAWQEGF